MILLLKIPGVHVPPETLRAFCPSSGARDGVLCDVLHGVDAPETYAYLGTPDPGVTDSGPDALIADVRGEYPALEVVTLERTLDIPGHSAGKPSPWHYVVETDVLRPAEADFHAWYTTEHMPGLAAVPGTVRACRYLGTGSPRHYAAYDLETLETFGSPPWLAVRATDWSSRVRPNFINTKRTMFRRA